MRVASVLMCAVIAGYVGRLKGATARNGSMFPRRYPGNPVHKAHPQPTSQSGHPRSTAFHSQHPASAPPCSQAEGNLITQVLSSRFVTQQQHGHLCISADRPPGSVHRATSGVFSSGTGVLGCLRGGLIRAAGQRCTPRIRNRGNTGLKTGPQTTSNERHDNPTLEPAEHHVDSAAVKTFHKRWTVERLLWQLQQPRDTTTRGRV